MSVVAEGVEMKDQLAFLSREACHEIQGYLLGDLVQFKDHANCSVVIDA